VETNFGRGSVLAMIVTVTLNPALDRTLTVPRILFDEMVQATAARLDWGGKGFNVSRALHALGVENVAMGLVGGATGQMLERGLSGLGIVTDLVQIAGETRTNVVITEADGEHYVKVNEAGPLVQPAELSALLERIRGRVASGDIWVLSGSLPLGVPNDFYAQLVILLRGAGVRVLLDTSGEPLRLGCAAGPYLVKPNTAEAEAATGCSIGSAADALDAAEFFLHRGCELVALSLAEDGLLLASQREAVWARPPRVQVHNSVGAGDALLAGVAWALEQGESLDEMARWGVGCGTAAAARKGVSVGTLAEIEKLREQAQVVWMNKD